MKAARFKQQRLGNVPLECLVRERSPPNREIYESPIVPAVCPPAEEAVGGRPGVPLNLNAPDCTERYSTLLHCGGATLLLRRAEARRGPTINHDYWWTVVRSLPGDGSSTTGHFSAPSITMPTELNMSHNAAFLCVGGSQLHVYGG